MVGLPHSNEKHQINLNPERIIKNSLNTTRKASQKVKNGTSVCYNKEKIFRRLDQKGGPKDGQENQKNRKKEIKKILKKLNLSDYEYVADDENITLSAMALSW